MLLQIVVLVSIAVGVVVTTIAESDLLSPFRMWVHYRSPFFGKLVRCPYCLAHWVAFVAWLPLESPTTYLFYCLWLTSVGLASLVSRAVVKAYES